MQLEVQGHCESFVFLKHSDLMNVIKSILTLREVTEHQLDLSLILIKY